MDRDAITSGGKMKRSEFVQEIKSTKPHFAAAHIEDVLAELEGQGYIERRQ